MATEAQTLTAAETLAQFVHDLSFNRLPAAVIHAAKRVLLDTLGAGLGGSTAEEGRITREVLAAFGSVEGATAWGSDRQFAPPSAALVNGTAVHSLELDDFHGCDHSGAVVIPAALAIAETEGGSSGAQLLTAIVAGYDLARRPMEAAGGYDRHNGRGWHSTGTAGSFGAAAAAAKMLALDTTQTTWTIGLAGSFTGGLWAFIDDGAMSKRLHPGKASENGVISAYLARGGFTGPTRIFEAEWGGFLRTYADGDYDLDALTVGLGDEFRIMLTGFKPYASCRGVHSAVDSVFFLRSEHDFDPADISKIIVRARPLLMDMVGNTDIQTMLDAQMSLPYGIAVALLSGNAGISQYTPERRASADVRDLISKIEMVADTSAVHREEPIVEIHLVDGRKLIRRVDIALGDAENPLSDEALTEKFRDLAGMALPADQVEQIIKMVWTIEQLDDVRDLCALLRKTA